MNRIITDRGVDVIAETKENHQRLLLSDNGRCYCIAVDRRSMGSSLNDSIHENSEEVVWSVMGGHYVLSDEARIGCEWILRLVRTMRIAGRDNFYQSCMCDGDERWDHVFDHWRPESPAGIEGWQQLQCPLVDTDDWLEFNNTFVDWLVIDPRTKKAIYDLDQLGEVRATAFLGIRTGMGQYTLYDLKPGAHLNDAYYSNRGFGAPDLTQVGDGFAPIDQAGETGAPTPRGAQETTSAIRSLYRVGWIEHTDRILRFEANSFRRSRTADRPDARLDTLAVDDERAALLPLLLICMRIGRPSAATVTNRCCGRTRSLVKRVTRSSIRTV